MNPQPLNAILSIEISFESVPIFSVSNPKHPSNADSPIFVTISEIVSVPLSPSNSPFAFLNALPPMLDTFPPIVTSLNLLV